MKRLSVLTLGFAILMSSLSIAADEKTEDKTPAAPAKTASAAPAATAAGHGLTGGSDGRAASSSDVSLQDLKVTCDVPSGSRR